MEVPIQTRAGAFDTFAGHVNRGKVTAFRTLGLDLVMGERRGIRFADAYDGRWYVDCHVNGGVFNLGHRHPAVVEAVRAAMDALDIGNHHLVSPWRARLAQRLSQTTGGQLPGVVFGVSGGEANDLAIKVARGVTGRQRIVSAVGGYHGHTGLSLAAGDPSFREVFGPNLPGFVQVPFNDLDAMARDVDADTAAVILEPIPATLGMLPPAPGYLAAIRDLCDERGVKLILDEVQTGLGRTGTVWYHQQEGITPDLLTTGKGLSGGMYPITATLMTRELHAFFDDRPFIHVSTFGGADVGCAAADAVLDLITGHGFLDRVTQLGDTVAAAFEDLPFQLRRRGLFMGLVFPDASAALDAVRALIGAGIFVVFAANDPSVVQFLPPLVMTDAEADELIATVRSVLT